MLGCAGGLAHRPRGKRGKRGGEDRAAVYVSFGTALRRRPVDDPAWKLCGLWMHAYTHTQICARAVTHTIHRPHIRCLNPISSEWSYIFTSAILSCVCHHLFSGSAEVAEVFSRPPLAAYQSSLVCLFYDSSRAAAFAGVVSSHTVLTQHCL